MTTRDDASNLAAETNICIGTQLKADRSSKRAHEITSIIAADLSDAEIRACVDWYGATTPTITSTPGP